MDQPVHQIRRDQVDVGVPGLGIAQSTKLPAQKFDCETWTSACSGSNSEFVEKVIKHPTSNVGHWCENADTALHHGSLDDTIHLVHIGFLGFSGKFVDPDTAKREVNSGLEVIKPTPVKWMGVKLSGLPKR